MAMAVCSCGKKHRNRTTTKCNDCRPQCQNEACHGTRYPSGSNQLCSSCLWRTQSSTAEESTPPQQEQEEEEEVKVQEPLDLVQQLSLLSVDGFTQEQQTIIDHLESLDRTSSRQLLLVDAPGGTGKSFTLKHFARDPRFQFVAPTHHACKVLRASGIKNVMTIDKFLGLKFEYDSEGNRLKKYSCNSWGDCRILVVDECSMVNKEQLSHLISNKKVHVLFCGDRAQLPPIDKDSTKSLSPVYELPFDQQFQLTRIMRTDQPSLIECNAYYRAKSLRVEVNVSTLDPALFVKDSARFRQLALKAFENDEDAVILAYRNVIVNHYNDIVRCALFGDDALDYECGENLMVDEYFTVNGRKYYTGDSFKLVDVKVQDTEVTVPIMNEKRLKAFDTRTISMFQLTDENGVTIYKPVNAAAKKQLDQAKKDYKQFIKTQSSAALKRALWKDLEDFCSLYDAKVKYRYAMTVHKSQAQGFDNVFLCFNDIFGREKDQLTYVGVSRARKMLLMLK